MKVFIPIVLVACIAACKTTNPQAGASIAYRMPRTDTRVTLTVDVTRCVAGLKDDEDVGASFTLKAESVAGAQDQLWTVSGAELASASAKRQVTIDVDDNGVISAINTTVTDQKTAILANVVKLAATISPLLLATTYSTTSPALPPRYKLKCTKDASNALDMIHALKAKIDTNKAILANDADPDAVQKRINAYASQIAGIKADLHKEASYLVELKGTGSKPPSGAQVTIGLVPFKLVDFDSLLHVTLGSKEMLLSENAKLLGVVASYDVMTTNDGLEVDSRYGKNTTPEGCGLHLRVPSPVLVTFKAIATGELFERAPTVAAPSDAATSSKGMTLPDSASQVTGDLFGDPIKANVTMPVAQLAPDEFVCLSTKFGENRTVGLKFDKFGRHIELAWSSDARAANATSALATAAPDAMTIVNTGKGRSLAADKAELDQLNTEQALMKARTCQAKLDAGATSCDIP